jgi:hypothetical protein
MLREYADWHKIEPISAKQKKSDPTYITPLYMIEWAKNDIKLLSL